MNAKTGAEVVADAEAGGRPAEAGSDFVLHGPDVLALFEASVSADGGATAVRYGSRSVSYAELDAAASALSERLPETWRGSAGVTAVVLEDRLQILTVLLAVLRAGGVFAPLDPEAPSARRRRILSSLRPDCVVTDAEVAGALGAELGDLPTLVLDGEGSLTGTNGNGGAGRGAAPPDPTAMRYVYYTSGSTGTPKGIAGTMKGLSHFIRWEIETFGIAPGTRVSQLTVPFFDVFLRDVLVPLCSGGCVCIPRAPGVVLDREVLARWLDEEGVNLVHCVPTVFAQLARSESGAALSSLKTVLMAGEVLPVEDVRRWIERHGSRVELVNLYGSTETTMVKFFHRVKESDLARGFVPIGRPMKGAKALVLDEDMQVCPPGAVGEIYIRSPYLTLGYLREPELTAQVFVPNPFSGDPQDLIFRTGDLGRVLDDGNFQFLGRRDTQLKIRGVRVEPGEVENALLEHPSVQSAAVVARQEKDGAALLVGYVAAPEAEAGLGAELRQHLEARLPYYLVPSIVVVLEELPRLPNGKLDTRSLPDPAEAPPDEEAIAPRTETEEILASIWAEVLDRPQVYVKQDFFRIGGHSLMAAQVISRIRKALNVDLPLRVLFEASTVEALARHLETLRWMSQPEVSPEGGRQEIEL